MPSTSKIREARLGHLVYLTFFLIVGHFVYRRNREKLLSISVS
jgi:hypothetical protein